MAAANDTPSEDRFAELLAAYDEALAAGLTPPPTPHSAVPPELLDELQGACAVLRRLEQDRQRGSTPAPDRLPAGEQPGEKTGQRLGRFQILRLLGRGGGGFVFLAFDPLLRREVALKVPHLATLVTGESRRRFLREAQLAAGLEHPNLIPVYEAGEDGAFCYIASAYCPGPTLRAWLADRAEPVPPRTAAQVTAALADALAHVHGRGVLHRDIKPSNVLLDPLGTGIPGVGTPRLTDFGLARPAAASEPITRTGTVLGTPLYMAPEQAQGRGEDVCEATDVYALGLLLYEMLTGQVPFQGASDVELLRRICADEPAAPRRLWREIPRDLEVICLKCLDKNPRRRYPTAKKLGDDLRHYLQGEPIHARPVGAGERTLKWARRKPAAAALVVLGVLVVLTACVGLLWLDRQTRADRAAALVEKLLSVDVPRIPDTIDELLPFWPWAEPHLRRIVSSESPDSAERLRAGLALVRFDPGLADFLGERILTAKPKELKVIRSGLAGREAALVPRLWDVAANTEAVPGQRLRAACALAAFDPASERWSSARRHVVQILVQEDPQLVSDWTELLRPVRGVLAEPLKDLFHDRKSPERSHLAASVLAEYYAGEPAELIDLLLEADPRQFEFLFLKLRPDDERAVALLNKSLAEEAPPETSENEVTRLSQRQANAAAALLRLGRGRDLWQLFRQQETPDLRSTLIHRLGPLNVDVSLVARQIEQETDPEIRRALILSLGQYEEIQLTERNRGLLSRQLQDLYQKDPDPGTHSAIDWLLRQCWQQGEVLDKLDGSLAKEGQQAGFRWCVTPQGHTLALVPDLAAFRAGAAEGLPPLPLRPFAIGTKEVTARQFRESRRIPPENMRFPPRGDCPANGVNVWTAAQFCNWLSKKEGIPPEEWCYLWDGNENSQAIPKHDYLRKTGYRLPTEAEWVYACRAGTATSRFFGHSGGLLGNYAWYRDNADDQVQPVGQLKPNDLGLFDVLGNVGELCFDVVAGDPHAGATLRGAGARYRMKYVHATYHEDVVPWMANEMTGFRIAQTIVPDR
jgi:tRNA A-37 threonylcarbamoyl transferase component Bud32